MMRFYKYWQNNSGGTYAGELGQDCTAAILYVEAASAEEADRQAVRVGVYFDGVDDDIDCECCGDRWDRASSDYYVSTAEQARRDGMKNYSDWGRKTEPYWIVFADGRIEKVASEDKS